MFEEGNEIPNLLVEQGLPPDAELVDAQLEGVAFDNPILELLFECGPPEVEEREIIITERT
ncbi:MAG: hypothetical protein ABEI52_09210 [Halobacteriaceae archaeon]